MNDRVVLATNRVVSIASKGPIGFVGYIRPRHGTHEKFSPSPVTRRKQPLCDHGGMDSILTIRQPAADRVERVLTERLFTGHTTLRMLSLLLWVVFALAYGRQAPWWMIAAPAA